MKDYYKSLGIEEWASQEEIRARWIELRIELTKRNHPDLKEGGEIDEKIKEINEAYQILKDSSTRSKYDLERALKRSIFKRSYRRKERRFHIKKKLIFSISILTTFLILGLIIFKRPQVTIQPKEVSKVAQESPKMAPQETGKVEEPKPIMVEPPVTPPSRAGVEPKPDVKPSTQAISKPEITLKVEKGVPKEISKVVVRERPQVVTKEIKKVEEPKATVRELLPPPKTKPSVKVEKPAPKEVSIVPQESPKIIPREIAKIEEPKPSAREPLPTLKPETPVKSEEVVAKEISKIIPPPPLIAKEEEVRQFFANYIHRYNRKDIEGFLSFFSSKAVQNQKDGFEVIRKAYTNFFNRSQELLYRIEDMKIEIYQNSVEVTGRYEMDQILKKGSEKKVWRGHIRWVLGREDGALKILSLDYQHEKSS